MKSDLSRWPIPNGKLSCICRKRALEYSFRYIKLYLCDILNISPALVSSTNILADSHGNYIHVSRTNRVSFIVCNDKEYNILLISLYVRVLHFFCGNGYKAWYLCMHAHIQTTCICVFDTSSYPWTSHCVELPLFRRRHYWVHFLEFERELHFHWNMFLSVLFTLWQHCLDNGLSPNRRQAIIWTNYGLDFSRMNASIVLNELHSSTAASISTPLYLLD